MKRFSIIILTAYITFLSACYKDKGNYDYRDINEIKISGLAAGYAYVLGTTLHIDPAIQMSQKDLDTAAAAYYWILYKDESTIIDTIGRSAVLDTRIVVEPAVYTLWLRVVDKATGVTYKANTKVTVSTLFSIGMLLIGTDNNGNAEAEMISMVKDTIIFRNILSSSGLPGLRDPMSCMFFGGTSTNPNIARLWVMTKSGSYFLDRLTMGGNTSRKFANICITNEIANKEAITPVVGMPQVRDKGGATSGGTNAWGRAVITTDGDIFATHSLLNGGDYYANPINREATDFSKRLKAAPYFWYAIANYGSSPSMMWYDTDNQRFMVYANFVAANSTAPADVAGDIFSWNLASQGRTLVYGENSRNTDNGSTNGNSFAIVKDNTGAHYIYKFYATGTAPQKRDLYTVSPIAIDFDKADFYAFSSKRTVIFYSVGNKLYAYDYNKGLEKFYQFPELSADEITMLKFDTQIDFSTNSLYVATYNGTTKGRLRRYNVGSNPNTVDITPVPGADWDGMIKIKDMNWRGVN
ncbi:PKD-like family lipoprotein [Niastella populi]|nr:PKD-like family lipoprotein [Niastella populi]